MHLDYRIVFDQCWRVGSGEAAGAFLDDLVRRDGNRLPFVPGSTVRGIVADALRTLCETLGVRTCDRTAEREEEGAPAGSLCGVTDSGWCPLCALVGSVHREGLASWGPARLLIDGESAAIESPGDRRALGEQAEATPGVLTRSHPHTAIDRRTGRAAEEKLFSLEEARSDLVLTGRIDLSPEIRADQLALLVAALLWVREIGGGRRRGLGGCRIQVEGGTDLAPHFGSWREAIRSLASPAEPAGTSPPAATAAPAPVPARSRPRPQVRGTALQLDAWVVGEVSIGGRPEMGNLIPGLPFVPGSTVRGALASRWSGDRTAADFETCFLSGRVRFGFLYPRRGQATALPEPDSLHTCKHKPGRYPNHGFVDLLFDPGRDDRCSERECKARLRPWGPHFGEGASAFSPRLALSPHNRIAPERQTVEALFAYEALAEGTPLRGFLRADREEDLASLLEGTGLAVGDRFALRVGRRKGALGWLDCKLSELAGTDSGIGLFPDGPSVPDTAPAALRIDLLTPAILRDEHLRFRETLTPRDLGVDRSAFDSAYATTHTLAGWNSAHRLPKADALAVAAGSSYLLRGVSDRELEALRRRALAGVGERRGEGFGALALRAVDEPERRPE